MSHPHPSLVELKSALEKIYDLANQNNDGQAADYIPQLAKVNPDLFGISVCSIDGHRFDLGDCDIEYSIQSCSKPLTYCIAREICGLEKVHQYVGFEPSGQAFNAFVMDDSKKPHNPMINAGAIMTCSLLKPDEEPAERFELIRSYLARMAGKIAKIGFDNGVFLSEKKHADRNFALAYFMNENRAFPTNTSLTETLDLYFQACSITMTCSTMAILAGTLANNGICPITDEQIFSVETVRDCLSLMYMCGMYDYSGQFAFKVGLPAKSGVSGCLMLVIPNQYGICIWSPRLDKNGNTVRGVQVCQELHKYFHFHIFHSLTKGSKKKSKGEEDPMVLCQLLITAASQGKNETVQDLIKNKNVDINFADYDGRTALHLAAANGHLETVDLLLSLGCHPRPLDRWGNSPCHEAKKGGFTEICTLLTEKADYPISHGDDEPENNKAN